MRLYGGVHMIPFYLRRLRVSRRVDACRGNHRYVTAAAPVNLTANQLRVVLRAIANLDPYTFADDLAEDIADENEPRSAEEVLLATIDATADDKLILGQVSNDCFSPTSRSAAARQSSSQCRHKARSALDSRTGAPQAV